MSLHFFLSLLMSSHLYIFDLLSVKNNITNKSSRQFFFKDIQAMNILQ